MKVEQGLAGLTVVDIGVGMAAALVAKYLREAGAAITRIEPASGDPFYQVYPAYEVWHRGSIRNSKASQSADHLNELLAAADVCILGGEDFPGLVRRSDAAALAARHPRLVVLDIEGYPTGTSHAGRPAADILTQARSGLSFEHYTQRPLLMSFEPSNYGAAMHGLCGLFAALTQRESTGQGQVVATSLYEGSLAWTMLLWTQMTKPTPAAQFVMPKDPWPLIFKCKDGIWVQVLLGSAGSKYHLYRILGIDDPSVLPGDSGMPQPGPDKKNFFGNIDLLQKHVEKFESAVLLAEIEKAGLPAEAVRVPGDCWTDPQVVHNQIIVRESDGTRHVGHPVVSKASPARRTTKAAPLQRPLTGVRVVDFGAFVAGPYSSTVLSDLGADVIKLEPISGDPNRSIFRSYTSVNRGKRVITVDLKRPEGLAIAKKLCIAADVVTNNFRPGVSARLGIDPDTLLALKPNLVVLESAAYGISGPRAQSAGFDMCFQALCGHDVRGGGQGNPPLWNRTSMVDFAGGLLGAVAVSQKLYERARNGSGSFIGAALLNAGLYLMSDLLQRADGSLVGSLGINGAQTGCHPAEQFYEASDGWIAIAARDAAMASRLLATLKIADQVRGPRAAWGDAEANRIGDAIKSWRQSELLAALAQADVWAEAACTDGESGNLGDAALARLGTVYATEHKQFGTVRQIGPLVRLSAAQLPQPREAPLAGQHTDEILGELGFSAAEIQTLRANKVVA